MPIKVAGDTITFSSGRTAYANHGIVGLAPDLEVHEGYDGTIGWPPQPYYAMQLTVDDMRELADMMVERWQRFKATLGEHP